MIISGNYQSEGRVSGGQRFIPVEVNLVSIGYCAVVRPCMGGLGVTWTKCKCCIAGLRGVCTARIIRGAAWLWLLASLPLQAGVPDQQGALGVWTNEKSTVAVRIVACGSELCGHIVWLAKPYRGTGALKRDWHNPNPGKREQPLCGLRVLRGFRQTAEHSWDGGLIYDPRKGKTYHSYLTLSEPDELRVRAYMLLPLFGKTQMWRRATVPPGYECPRQPRATPPAG